MKPKALRTLEVPITFKVPPDLDKALRTIKRGMRSYFIQNVLREALIKRCNHCNGSGFSNEWHWVVYGERKDGSIGPVRRKDDQKTA